MRDSTARHTLMSELANELMKKNPDKALVADRAQRLGLRGGPDLESLMIEVLGHLKSARSKSRKAVEVAP